MASRRSAAESPPWLGSYGAFAEESGPVAVNRPKLFVTGRARGSTARGNRTTLVGRPDLGSLAPATPEYTDPRLAPKVSRPTSGLRLWSASPGTYERTIFNRSASEAR